MPYPGSVDIGRMNVTQEISFYFRSRLEAVFAGMDRKYAEAANHYGFFCSGCEDNCCRSFFYHYCLVEYWYIRAGFRMLEPRRQAAVLLAAEQRCRQGAADENGGRSSRRMCPLNFDGLCVLYPYRPMICRLHGIPHELTKPGHPTVHGPGCDTFNRRCRGKSVFRFDRTPFYTEMADLEKEFRRAAGFDGKIKMTVAQMLLDIGYHESRRIRSNP